MIITKRHIAFIILVLITIFMVIAGIVKNNEEEAFTNTDVKIVLDAGHGAPDGGAVAKDGTQEKDVNIALVKKLQEIMEGKGFDIVLTRTDDSGLQDDDKKTIREMKVSDMNNRLEIIKSSNAELLLSIHMNYFEDKKVNGLYVFYDEKHPEIESLADEIEKNICTVTGASLHAVRTADTKLFLMKNTPIPAILIECGFLSNEEEEKKLVDEEYQAKIAWAIANAVEKYFY